jgi:hypothetical protein
MANGVSVPSDFPHIEIYVNDNPDDGYIFIDNRGGGGRPYNIIFDNTGLPVWYIRPPDERRDFKVQSNGWATMMIRDGYGGNGWGFIALDQNYNYVKTFRAVDGYATDEHELVVLPDSGYLLIVLKDHYNVDMSEHVPGDNRIVNVSESCIQEFSANDQKIFQWNAFDNFELKDVVPDELNQNYIRFPHMNAIAIDEDGHIVLSSRHISEITKIHRQTGEIIWRLGGAHNQFTFVNDSLDGFTWQHAVSALGNGHYLLFDNGNDHQPPMSRSVEYALNTDNMTATLVWEFRNPPNTSFSHYMGNTQRLPNGNTLINWAVGDRPKLTEVRPNGEVAFEMNFVDRWECYRVSRHPWQGIALVPTLIIEPHSNYLTLLLNKYGDPDVDHYKIYSGTSPNPTTVLTTSEETLIELYDLENNRRHYFRVTAVDKNGQESGYSNEENVFVSYVKPGENMILNGDFSAGKNDWIWELQSGAQADWNIVDEVSHFDINDGSDQIYDVQLRQNGKELIRNKEYIFEFDAWADVSRIIEAKVGQDNNPFINYSKIGFSNVLTTQKHFSYTFIMEDPTDYNARVVFNTGTSDVDVYIDNVSLKLIDPTGILEQQPNYLSHHTLVNNFPNPFNARTNINYQLSKASEITIKIYNIRGQVIATLVDEFKETGNHYVSWDARNYSSGLYFYEMIAGSYVESKKMLLLK